MSSVAQGASRLRSLIDDADAVLVGIGSGMSSAATADCFSLSSAWAR